MKFLDDYTIVSDIEGAKCSFVRSTDGRAIKMYVDIPGGLYIYTIETEDVLTREKFREFFYFYGLLNFKKWKNNMKDMKRWD